MFPDVPGQPFKLFCQVYQHPDFFLFIIALFQRLFFGQRTIKSHFQCERNQLGYLVDETVGMSEDPADVTHYRFCGHAAERDDLGDTLTPVTVGYVFNHFIAPVHAEVHVEIRQRYPIRIQETLEQQFMINGVQVSNAQNISNQGSSAGAPSRAYRYTLLFCPVDEVGNNKKISREPHVDNNVKLHVQALPVLLQVNFIA